jgi:acetylornithine deacetylase/succinyl-diaminopimelate desuccinylase-like protein
MPAAVAAPILARGAAGLVLLSPTPDGLIGHFTASFYPPPPGPPWEGRVLPVPGVTVEAAAGERLLAALSAGPARVRVEHQAEYGERTAVNVVGEIPGAEAPQERIVVGAHYDTQLDSPGAADNGTGLAALLGIARAFAGTRPRRTLALVAFAGEELACWGATAYVRAHAAEPPRAMVNLDALGPPVLAKRTIVADPAIAGFAADSARRAGWEVEVEIEAREFPYSDLAPFVEAGVPGCQIWRYPPPHPYYHSAGDTPRWVDYGLLAEDARAGANMAFRLANEEQIPHSQASSPWNPTGRRAHAAR